MVSGSDSQKIATAVDYPNEENTPAGFPNTNAPADRLYIYYFEGRVDSAKTELGRCFIGNWEEEGESFLFFSEPADSIVEQLCGMPPFPKLLDTYQMTYDQWLGETFTSFSVGRFNIRPAWEKPEPAREDQIILDPGVVFGTGAHPTTRSCILALEDIFDRLCVDRVIDLGAGTGLLSLVSARLGCKTAVALDLNLLAVQTVRRNILHNHMEDKILAVRGRAEQLIDIPADLVVANIHYDVMKRLVQTDGFIRKKAFILSGLLRSEASDIARRLAALPIRGLQKWEDGGVWNTFIGVIEEK